MGWLLSLSFLSVLFTCSIVAAQNNFDTQTNSNSDSHYWPQASNGNSYGAEQSSNANQGNNGQLNHNGRSNGNSYGAGQSSTVNHRAANNGQRNHYGYSNENSYGAEQGSTDQAENVSPNERNHLGRSYRYPQWPVYNCRESILNYDCVFHHVSIDRGTVNFYFGYTDVAHNNQKNITFKNSTMRKLPEALLNSFREVELLDLTGLQIEEIEPYAFSNGILIRELYMGFNAIRELPTAVFRDLRSLSTLVLDRNNLVRLPKNIFYHTKNISVLSIANNNLERIDDNTFQNSMALEGLILSSNKLTHIDLSRIPSLYHGNVSSNLLTTLSIPDKLAELDASHNRINTVTGPFNRELQVLLLQHNNLTDTLWLLRYSGLINLDLSYNELEKITHLHFKNMYRLERLYLNNNRLVAMNLDAQPIRTLKVLDVRHNHLLYVEKNQKQFDILNQLYLDHNSIVTLKLSPNNTLEILTLSDNDWDCNNLNQLFLTVRESVIGDSDRNCKSDYQLMKSICCKDSDKPYLDRLIQHISLTSVAEKIQRAQGRCSATDAISSVQSLENSMMQKGGGALFQPNPQLQAEINQLQVDVDQLMNTQSQLGKRLQGMHNEIDNTLRRYRVTKEGLVHPSENLGKVFEHLQNRRTFKAQETRNHQSEFESKKQKQTALMLENEELQNNVDANKKKISEIKMETKRKESAVKRLEAKKNNNAPARQITK